MALLVSDVVILFGHIRAKLRASWFKTGNGARFRCPPDAVFNNAHVALCAKSSNDEWSRSQLQRSGRLANGDALRALKLSRLLASADSVGLFWQCKLIGRSYPTAGSTEVL